jgi:peptidyl-prolyl cis-trans isomerase D
MMNFLRKHMRIIFLITIIGFLAGAFIGFGGYLFGSKSSADAVLEINGTKVPYRKYVSLLNRTIENLRRENKDVSESSVNQIKQEVIQDLIQEEVFWQESKKYGITVSDAELAADIQHYPAFQREGRFDRNAYFQVLYQVLKTTPREFEESRRKQIASMKLRQLIGSSVKISEPELQLEYARTHGGKMTGFEKERTAFLDKLRQEKVMLVFNEWFKALNQTVKIQVHLNEIERTPS